MDNEEKLSWAGFLLAMWGILLGLIALTVLIDPDHPGAVAVRNNAVWGFIIGTGIYLFVLLLRNIYLAGKEAGQKGDPRA